MTKPLSPSDSSRRRNPAMVLADRARKLAAPVEARSLEDAIKGYMVFMVSGELYAVPTAFVKEVLALKEYTSIPGSSPLLRGLFTLRGQIFPLLDTSMILNLTPDKKNDGLFILLVQLDGLTVGLLVDEYREIRMLREEELLQDVVIKKGPDSELISAVTLDQVRVLNVSRFLTYASELMDESRYQRDTNL